MTNALPIIVATIQCYQSGTRGIRYATPHSTQSAAWFAARRSGLLQLKRSGSNEYKPTVKGMQLVRKVRVAAEGVV